MDAILFTIVIVALLVLITAYLFRPPQPPAPAGPIPESYRQLLSQYVVFYQQLSPERQSEFENRLQEFLSYVRITGVNTQAEDLDRVLVASSAVIPIFNFPGWQYVQLNEVLLYPDSFNHEFEQAGGGRNILGMVGSGAMNGMMILSQHQLREAFTNKTGKDNVAIHEFVHLVDKTDGSIDGVPAFILDKQYIQPWLQLMHTTIQKMKENRSDINIYGATNEAEFFAVVAEYFFERPKLLKEKHPELYTLLEKIFGKAG